jgi:hypothetical protein
MASVDKERRAVLVTGLFGLWLSVPILIVVAGGLPIGDDLRALLVPLLLLYLVWPVIGLLSLICTVYLAATRLWLQAALVLLIPVSVFLCIFGELKFALLDPVFRANELLHFATTKESYDRQLLGLPQSERHLHTFIWESDPVGGSGIAYDDSDQILWARNRRSKQWLENAGDSALSELCRAEAVGSHWYIIFFGCFIEPR